LRRVSRLAPRWSPMLGRMRNGCNWLPGSWEIGKWCFRTNLRTAGIESVCAVVQSEWIQAQSSHEQKARRLTPAAAASGQTAPASRDAPFSPPNSAPKRMSCVLPSLAYALSALCSHGSASMLALTGAGLPTPTREENNARPARMTGIRVTTCRLSVVVRIMRTRGSVFESRATAHVIFKLLCLTAAHEQVFRRTQTREKNPPC
jgi:hypothetical protein